MRALGIDLGSKRIGVALANSDGTLATPYEVVARSGDRTRDHQAIAALAEETGAGPGAGTTCNLPLPARCGDDAYLGHLDRALEAIDAFGEAPLVVSLGLDTYGRDPICDLALTTEVYAEVGRRVGALRRPTVALHEDFKVTAGLRRLHNTKGILASRYWHVGGIVTGNLQKYPTVRAPLVRLPGRV